MNAPVYDSATSGSGPGSELRELVRYRTLLRMMVVNGVKNRYKRSAIGVLWSLIHPLISMGVIAFAFSGLLKGTTSAYHVFVLTGLVFWNFFSQTTGSSAEALTRGSPLLGRVYVPPSIYAVTQVGVGLTNLFISMGLLFAIMLVTGVEIPPSLTFLPVSLVIACAFTLGVSLLISTAAVFFGDTAQVYLTALQAFFFLTPVMYPEEILPEEYRGVVDYNPVYAVLQVFREPIYPGVLPTSEELIKATCIAAATLVLGLYVFTRNSDKLAYRV